MYSYITDELPKAVFSAFSQIESSRVSITGHSMGGHGALTLFLKNPGRYKSCSAFAPIANPLKAPWGEKAFKGYFGEESWQSKGKEHDATELVKGWKQPLDILIDVVSMTSPNRWHSLTSARAQATIFTSKVNSSPRTSQKPPKLPEWTHVSISGFMTVMITAIILLPLSPMTTFSMRPNIFLRSMYRHGSMRQYIYTSAAKSSKARLENSIRSYDILLANGRRYNICKFLTRITAFGDAGIMGMVFYSRTLVHKLCQGNI